MSNPSKYNKISVWCVYIAESKMAAKKATKIDNIILGFSYVDTQEVILLYLDELLICENIYFATNFVKLAVLKQKLWQFIHFGGHLDGHLGFSHLYTSEVIFMYSIELFIHKNL